MVLPSPRSPPPPPPKSLSSLASPPPPPLETASVERHALSNVQGAWGAYESPRPPSTPPPPKGPAHRTGTATTAPGGAVGPRRGGHPRRHRASGKSLDIPSHTLSPPRAGSVPVGKKHEDVRVTPSTGRAGRGHTGQPGVDALDAVPPCGAARRVRTARRGPAPQRRSRRRSETPRAASARGRGGGGQRAARGCPSTQLVPSSKTHAHDATVPRATTRATRRP